MPEGVTRERGAGRNGEACGVAVAGVAGLRVRAGDGARDPPLPPAGRRRRPAVDHHPGARARPFRLPVDGHLGWPGTLRRRGFQGVAARSGRSGFATRQRGAGTAHRRRRPRMGGHREWRPQRDGGGPGRIPPFPPGGLSADGQRRRVRHHQPRQRRVVRHVRRWIAPAVRGWPHHAVRRIGRRRERPAFGQRAVAGLRCPWRAVDRHHGRACPLRRA